MTAPEIRSQLDNWLWELSTTRTAPQSDQLAQLRQAWAELSTQLPEYYRPIIDDRMALVDSYLARA